jgi:membrane protein implicated in regulation of membrane protease activity
MSLLSFSPVLLWFLAGIVFLALELILPGLIVFFFGIGAWCAALAVYLIPISLSTQLLIFLAASLVALILLRSTLKKIFLGRAQDADARTGTIPPDATGEIVDDIVPPATGTIKYAGSFWQATAEVPLSKGTIVRIVEKTNLTVKVAPVTPQGDS